MKKSTRRIRLLSALGVTVALLSCGLPAAAVDVGPDVVVNGSFEQFSGVNPDKWSRWAPAGTGTVQRVEGMVGASAVQITTDTTSSRLALVQDVPVEPGLYRLDFMTRRSNMSGTGTAGIRVNVKGAASAPFIGGNTNTDGWQPVTGWVQVPAGSTQATLHVFNDMVRGSMAVDDVRFARVDAEDFVITSISAAGDVALDWDVSNPAGVDHYEILRAEAGTPDQQTVVRRVPASLTEATDQNWEPGKHYVYTVVARDAAGAELFRTVEAAIKSPAVSNIFNSSLTAIESDGKVHLGWAAGRDVDGTLSVVAAEHPLADGDLSAATTVLDDVAAVADADIPTTARHFALVADGKVIASASAAGTAHPRLMLKDDVLAKIDRLIAKPGTPQDLFRAVEARVQGGAAASGTSIERFSREAAFMYAVTREQRYADIAFDAFKKSAELAPFGAKQELDTANPTASMALTYDWAYNGWSSEQRAFAQDFFERASVFLELGAHPNMAWEDKASNWVGVTRGAELAADLAVRGDGDYGMRDARIARLLDQLTRHAKEGYTDQSWYQEGLDYLDYDNMIATTGVLGSFDAGIDALKSAWYEPNTANLLLHADSLRQGSQSSLQWGVGTGGHPAWPLYMDRLAEDGQLGRATAMFERTQGHLAENPWYSPAFALYAFVYWPENEAIDLNSDEILPALFDDEAGIAMFRNRVQDADDVLIGLQNRNHQHLGWSGYDTFGLSMISGDTMWATQPAKDQSNAAKYSRVIIDGKAQQSTGKGKTLATQAYDDQGGGYVRFDGSGNVGVQTATREAVVDMTPRPAADTVMAFSDSFRDAQSHRWTWQLVPQAGVSAEIGDVEDGVREITLRHDGAWLRIWLRDAEGADVSFDKGVLRIQREGASADFDLVMAAGASGNPADAELTGSIVSLDGFIADFDDLSAFTPASASPSWNRTTSYQPGDRVSHLGHVYEALRPTNAQEPGAKANGPWQEIAAITGTTLWTPTTRFERGDRVMHHGTEYIANRPSRGVEPGTSGSAWTRE